MNCNKEGTGPESNCAPEVRNAGATTDECIELAQALEQQRALAIVAAVKALPIGGADAIMPTPIQTGWQQACEEIEYRLHTEQWDFCGVPVGPAT